MTLEEIKEHYKMADIIQRYGLKENRAHFIRCPFHAGDNSPSLKIYPDSFYCFGCGKAGDIFKFVELMEDCSFKEAFLSLGGTYNRPKPSDLIRQYTMKKERERKQKKAQEAEENKKRLLEEIDHLKEVVDTSEPLSDEWVEAKRKLLLLFHVLEVGR